MIIASFESSLTYAEVTMAQIAVVRRVSVIDFPAYIVAGSAFFKAFSKSFQNNRQRRKSQMSSNQKGQYKPERAPEKAPEPIRPLGPDLALLLVRHFPQLRELCKKSLIPEFFFKYSCRVVSILLSTLVIAKIFRIASGYLPSTRIA